MMENIYSYYKKVVPTSLKMIVDSNGVKLPLATSVEDMHTLENHAFYSAKFDLDDLLSPADYDDKTSTGGKLNLKKHSTKIFVRLSMDTSIGEMGKSIAGVLPATDSISKLSINFTELYELK